MTALQIIPIRIRLLAKLTIFFDLAKNRLYREHQCGLLQK